MRVLVTGATGLVGNNVVRLLLERGHSVRVLTRATSDPRPLQNLNVERALGDIRDASSIPPAMDGMTHVVHCAGLVQIGWSGIELHRAINVAGTRNVAEAARRAGVRMVHVSSVDALGIGSRDRPADETTPRSGNTPCTYVVSKREAEESLQAVIADGLDAVIVNPGFMIGPWDWKPSSGKMLIGVGTQFALLAPAGGCSICDVRDVAAGILSALERGRTGQNYILGGHNMTYLDVWRLFARTGGSRPSLARMGPMQRFVIGQAIHWYGKIKTPEPEVNSALFAMSHLFHYYRSDRAQAELGYTFRPVEESAREAWNWLKEHGYIGKKTTAKK